MQKTRGEKQPNRAGEEFLVQGVPVPSRELGSTWTSMSLPTKPLYDSVNFMFLDLLQPNHTWDKKKQRQWVAISAFHPLFCTQHPQKGPWHQLCLGDLPKGSVLSTQLHVTGGALLTSGTGLLQIPLFSSCCAGSDSRGAGNCPSKKEIRSFHCLDVS